MENSKLLNFTRIVSKIMQIIMIIVAILCLVVLGICFVALSYSLAEMIKGFIASGLLNVNGISDFDSYDIIRKIAIIACLNGAISCFLTSLIFRNINRILTAIKNQKTPFSNENARLIKNIGIITIIKPLIDNALSLISSAMFPGTKASLELNISTFVIGLSIICLSKVFVYGKKLEEH